MTVKQLLDVFGSLGVEAYGEKGEEFDPEFLKITDVVNTSHEELE